MRSTLLIAAGVGALLIGGQALAASSSTAKSSTPPATPPADTSTGSATSPDTSAPPSTPPSAPPTATTATGTNTSATTGGFTVGQPVKDNTGATIGAIADLKSDAAGNKNAVIKMGNDQFQVSVDKLGSSDGAATINLTQAQIASMLHGSSGAPSGGAPSGGAPSGGSSGGH